MATRSTQALSINIVTINNTMLYSLPEICKLLDKEIFIAGSSVQITDHP